MMHGLLAFGKNSDQKKQNEAQEQKSGKKINNDENKKNPENPKSEDKTYEEIIKTLGSVHIKKDRK